MNLGYHQSGINRNGSQREEERKASDTPPRAGAGGTAASAPARALSTSALQLLTHALQ